jgi:hypothetical protein
MNKPNRVGAAPLSGFARAALMYAADAVASVTQRERALACRVRIGVEVRASTPFVNSVSPVKSALSFSRNAVLSFVWPGVWSESVVYGMRTARRRTVCSPLQSICEASVCATGAQDDGT